MRASGYYPSPVHGISTMPSSTVLYGYAKIQENLRSDPIEKLKRRPPLMFESKLSDTGDGTETHHTFTRNGVEHEIVVRKDGTVLGFIDGVLQTTTGDCTPYITSGEDSDIDMVTINDTTFILNREKTVLMETGTDQSEGNYTKVSYINILTALNYSETITISIRRASVLVGTVSYTVPDLGISEPDYDTADKARATAQVAADLTTLINTGVAGAATALAEAQAHQAAMLVALNDAIATYNSDPTQENLDALVDAQANYDAAVLATAAAQAIVNGGSWGLTALVKGSCVSVQSNADEWLDLEIETGQGTTSAVVINKTIEKTDGLPLFAVVGTVITVQPDPTTEKGTYYLVASRIAETANTSELEEVVWSETRNPVQPYELDAETMPYTATFSGGNIDVGQPTLGWTERETGNNTSVKIPKFVNQTIKRLGYMQTRLLVLTGSACVTTITDDLFDFWKASSVKLLVTDPISMASNAVNIDNLEHLLPHNKDMLITGPNAQFKISGETRLGPDTSAMGLTTSIEVDTTSKPVSMGNNIFFANKQGTNSGIIEYTGQKNTTQDKGVSITGHVTGYLKGTIIKMVANSNNEMLVVKTDGSEPNELFVYEQFTNTKDATVQKSWSKWVFPESMDIQNISLEFNKLSIISLLDGKLWKHAVYIDSKQAVEKDTTIFLDNKILVSTTGTVVVLPTDYVWNSDNVVVQDEDCNRPLYQVEYEYNAIDHELTLATDVGVGTVHIGEIVGGVYQPNRPYRRNADGRVLTEEKIRISNIFIEVSDSYALGVELDSEYYNANRKLYTSDVAGKTIVGQKAPISGAFNYPFMKDADLANIKITTEGYLGLTITNLRWRGQYTRLTTII